PEPISQFYLFPYFINYKRDTPLWQIDFFYLCVIILKMLTQWWKINKILLSKFLETEYLVGDVNVRAQWIC
ncbi:hypothetical protein J7J45_03410, partial [Candidatus Aerophobetes bacterium]|nr:hypothetical protein [Candidatus Aerophobetes bacterium]